MTRSSVVLPQPDGPMKETKSPSAISRSTFDSASTSPSAVWKVSEMPWALTASAAGLVTWVGSSGARMGSTTCNGVASAGPDAPLRPSARNDIALRRVIEKYWQTQVRKPRPIFTHAERILGKPNHEDSRPGSYLPDRADIILPQARDPFHTCAEPRRTPRWSLQQHETRAFQVHRRSFARASLGAEGRIRRRGAFSRRRPESRADHEF